MRGTTPDALPVECRRLDVDQSTVNMGQRSKWAEVQNVSGGSRRKILTRDLRRNNVLWPTLNFGPQSLYFGPHPADCTQPAKHPLTFRARFNGNFFFPLSQNFGPLHPPKFGGDRWGVVRRGGEGGWRLPRTNRSAVKNPGRSNFGCDFGELGEAAVNSKLPPYKMGSPARRTPKRKKI